MKALDIMTTDVITISPDTPVGEIAELLLEKRISGLPVVDKNGKLAGVVSEGDLIHRQEIEPNRNRSWWLELLSSREDRARDYSKFHGRTASDVMTTDVVSVEEETPISEIASLLESKRIKRVPVCRDGKLVGIVSRANLIQAVSVAWKQSDPKKGATDDRRIREGLDRELRKSNLTDARHLNFLVDKGIVHLWGMVGSEDERRALRTAASNIEGVQDVRDDLEVQAHERLVQGQDHRFP